MSLRRKLNLALLLALTLTLCCYAAVDIWLSQSQLVEKAELASQNTAKRLGITLADSMWNFNVDNAKKVAESELGTNDLVSVSAFDNENKPLFNISWDNETQTMSDKAYTDDFLFKKDQIIKFNDQGEEFDAGRVQLIYSNNSIDAAFASAVKSSVMQIIILDVIILIIMGLLIHKLVLYPLNSITARVNDIAQGKGDLTKRINFKSSDELGLLSDGINAFINNIHIIIKEISAVTHKLDETSQNGQDNTGKLNQIVDNLNFQVSEIAGTVHNLSITSKDVADQATDSANITKRTTELVSTGIQDVNHTNKMIQALAASVTDSTQKTAKLDEYSQNITTVIEVIKSIADQTNLLALNAAIEAARAGEQGRGFAVVADEVRTLAQRTQESTGQITDIIEQLQGQASETLSVMKDGLRQAEENVEHIAHAEETFENIRDAIDKNLKGANVIASAASEQNNNLSAIEKNVEHIQAANERALSIAKQSALTNADIVKMSHTVAGLIEKFKI
ncbi:MAG: methyl-accepting chemotaxis protein [Flavobacteriales bacterium]|jgi:methyl-accepting chemotaxis protein